MTLERISRDLALERLRHHIHEHPPRTAQLPLAQALGLICAQDLFAAHATPDEPRSTVDGYALSSAQTRAATPDTPLQLRIEGQIRPSTAVTADLAPGQAVAMLTGGPLPQGADCVLRAEEAEAQADILVIRRELRPQEHVRAVGSDLKAGTRIVRRGDDLSPQVLAALAVSGVMQALAYQPPQVQVLALGNELSALGTAPSAGRMPADNLLMVAGLLRQRGVADVRAEVAANNQDGIAQKLTDAAGCQCIVTTGGTGPGERDFILEAALLAGFTPLFKGLTLTPGKSVLAATRGETLLLALPGTPWAVFALMHALVLPTVCWLRGRTLPAPGPILARPLGMPPLPHQDWEKLVPCAIAAHGAELQAQPLLDRARESRLDMLEAQGLLIITAKSEPGGLLPMIPIWENRRGHKLD